jgi:peptide/nickel transport system substrate-binding protein
MTYETVGEFVDLFAPLAGQSEVTTANTVVIRPNQNNPPYDDVMRSPGHRDGRRPAGLSSIWASTARAPRPKTTTSAPIHPEYAELPPITIDKDAAYRAAAGGRPRRPRVRDLLDRRRLPPQHD